MVRKRELLKGGIALVFLILLFSSYVSFVSAEMTGNETMTRTTSKLIVSPGENFTLTYQAYNLSGDWGASVVDTVSGGCTPAGEHMFLMINNPTNTITVTAPQSGSCTFHGDYKFGSFPIVNFTDVTIVVNSTIKSMTRTFPTAVQPGSTFTVTYSTSSVSGKWFVAWSDVVTGGCTPANINYFLSSGDPPILSSDTKSFTFTAPQSGSCTFVGNYNFAGEPIMNFTNSIVTITCNPSCSGKQCGSDGCGGSCGTCSTGYSCSNNQCVLIYTPKIAYILKNPRRPDAAVMSAFAELGTNVTLIAEKDIAKLLKNLNYFSQYTAVFIGNERFTRSKVNIANIIEKNPTIIMNRYYGPEWGLTDADGISQLSSNYILSVRHMTRGILPAYTTPEGKSQPYYYLAWANKAPELVTVAETYMGDGGLGAVIAVGNASDHLLNGKTLQDNLCFFGIAKTKYWTPQSKQMFKDCVGFVAVNCYTDLDCNDSDPHTEDKCINPGLVSSYCTHNRTIACFNDGECGADRFVPPLFCNGISGNDVWGNYNDYSCLSNGTTSSSCQLTTAPALNMTCVNGCSNGTCLPETIPPVINLSNLNPANNSNYLTNASISFQFNVTDDSPISRCNLSIIEDGTPATSATITRSAISTLLGAFNSSGVFHWRIICNDIYGNTGTSEIRAINVTNPQCSDGIDNDADGAIDFPADFSCASAQDDDESTPLSQCQDNVDNDADGWIDMIDPGCANRQDNNEVNTGMTECSDGIDNDADGLIDGYDPGCTDPSDDDEDNIANHVVISEVYYDAINESASEFVELYNPLGFAIDLAGWNIRDPIGVEATISSGTIPALGYFLIADANWVTNRDNMSWPIADLLDDLSLGNSNSGVALFNSSGVIIDAVGWGSPTNPSYYEGTSTAIVSQGYSIERLPGWPLGNGQDTNNNTFDFFAQQIANPTNSTSNFTNITYQCSDGIDNDLDGAVDYPNDFSCSSAIDDDETNPLAQCQDLIDNDGDGLIDMIDPGCANNQDDDEFNAVASCLFDSDCGSQSSSLICQGDNIVNVSNIPTCLVNGSCMMVNTTSSIWQDCALMGQICSSGSCVNGSSGNFSGNAMAAWGDYSNQNPESMFWGDGSGGGGTGWNNLQGAGAMPYREWPMWVDIEPSNDQMVMLIDDARYNNACKKTYARVWQNGAWTNDEELGGCVGYYYYYGKTSNLESFGDENNVMAVYSDGSSALKYRIWDGNSWNSESSTRFLSAQPYWTALKRDSASDDMVLIALDIKKKVYAEVWDGNSWPGADKTELEGTSYLGGNVDAEYFSNGHALVVWYDASSKQIQSKIWDGNSWGAEQNLPSVNNEIISYMQLASNGEEMTLVSKSTNGNIRVFVYDGVWHNLGVVGVGSFGYKTIDAEYNEDGEAMVVWGQDNEEITRYALVNSGGIIVDGETLHPANREAVWIELAADTESDEMILAEVIPGANSYDYQHGRVYSQVWDGNSWGDDVLLEDDYANIHAGSVDVEYF